MSNVMAILQDVDKCMRCNGCVIACKREWDLAMPASLAGPQRSVVSERQRLAVKSSRRGDMGPFMRFTCWHCPEPPCAAVGACPKGAIKKEETGAVSIDNAKCDPATCGTRNGMKPCQWECQRGGYPQVGVAYESGAYKGPLERANKCTLCTGRAGRDHYLADGVTLAHADNADIDATNPSYPYADADTGLPTRATVAEITAVPEKAHEPACVSSCPAKALTWDTQANIVAYLEANYKSVTVPGSTIAQKNYLGNGSMFWCSKKDLIAPPKADPFIEDHIVPMASSMLSSGRILIPTLVVGGLAALSARRSANESETEGEV